MDLPTPDIPSDPSTAVLLAEHARLSALYQHNVEMGDRYITAYLQIISLMLAILIGVSGLGKDTRSFIPVELSLLVIVLAVGTVIFRRLVERRIRSTELLRALNRVHAYFVEKDPKIQAYLYWPANDDYPTIQGGGATLGGLRDIVTILNSLCYGFMLAVVLYLYRPALQIGILAAVGLFTSLIAWILHNRYSERQLSRADQELSAKVRFPRSPKN